jgi:hypothetical protein
MYAAQSTRFDLLFAIDVLARRCVRADASHMRQLKHLLGYIRGTTSYALLLGGGDAATLGDFAVFSDADDASDMATRHPLMCYISRVGGSTVSASSKLYRAVTRSSGESEIVAASEASSEVACLSELLTGFGVLRTRPPLLFLDSMAAIGMCSREQRSKRLKHIDRADLYVVERAQAGDLSVAHVSSAQNLADIGTKPLAFNVFAPLRQALGITCL